ncbi:MAG: OmpA family protein [Fibrobacter sp.]|nr:OmpA family protein [Fibrobacter sp.]
MKKIAMGVALAAAISAFAEHPLTINKQGFAGVNKTQSAQSLGHTRFVVYLLGDMTTGDDMFPKNDLTKTALDETVYYEPDLHYKNAAVEKFVGATANFGLAIGLGDYFDLGLTLPVHYENFNAVDKPVPCESAPSGEVVTDPSAEGVPQPAAARANSAACQDGLYGGTLGSIEGTKNNVSIGNLKADFKLRFPLPEDQAFDVAVFGGAAFGLASKTKQGLWIREPEYINKKTGDAYAFGITDITLAGGLAVTVDFEKVEQYPFLLHLNGGYRYVMNADYLSLPFISVAAELYLFDVISLFVEYYMDIETEDFVHNKTEAGMSEKQSLDLSQLATGVVFHTPVGLDFHLGASLYVGGKKYLTNVSVLQSPSRGQPTTYLAGTKIDEDTGIEEPNNTYLKVNADRIRVNPQYTFYAGITWNGFLAAQDSDGDGILDKEDDCPEEFGHYKNRGCPLGNPDTDEDGVCESWVAEKGLLDDFSDICEGVDKCPNEPGQGDDGCPLEDPDPDGDGVCDPWVKKKKMLKKFKGICKGVDQCPNQPGNGSEDGCPSKKPDPDGDGLCSPWVTDEDRLADFSGECKGYDMCPGEAGPKANKGCPWDDPDADNDGLCDPWVTEKKMGYYFEKAAENSTLREEYLIEKTCKGIDKCPTEFGPMNNEGCPLGNPDSDKDGLCDPWVSQRGFEEQYEGICKGIDQCPNDPGEEFAKGCPMDDPDSDHDGVCDEWVSLKKMLGQFKDLCSGRDKCPLDSGSVVNDGCPMEDPDPDHDGVCAPWVTEKKLQEQFKDVCKGFDKCPYDGGELVDRNGCPVENPDPDNDGVCDAWVKQKDLSDLFPGKCRFGDDGTIIVDKCPLDFGDPKFGGCAAPKIEKLDGVTFQSGKAILQNNAKKVLKNIARKLTSDPVYMELKLVIQGHTDNVGKPASNMKLSEGRAKAVMDELVRAGVNSDRITAVGCGQDAPVADNKTADGREENRRIEMHFVTPDDPGDRCEATFKD